MLLARRPSEERVGAFLAEQARLELSYPEVGATRATLPAGYSSGESRTLLGHGEACFARALAALRAWRMFELPTLQLFWPSTEPVEGAVVGVLFRGPGVWILNACRVVYTVDEHDSVVRGGFAYGTLPEHVERGEERFTVAWDRNDDRVWYEVLSFSRPQQWWVHAASPIVRHLQARFRRDTGAALARAVGRPG